MQEFLQIEELNIYDAIGPASLTKAQCKGALRAIYLIKEQRDGRIKVLTIAKGCIHRSLYDNSQTASPTVSMDPLMLSIMINALENRDAATADVVGAYLKAHMDGFVIMKFSRESVDIFCKRMNPEHVKFVVIKKGVKALYV